MGISLTLPNFSSKQLLMEEAWECVACGAKGSVAKSFYNHCRNCEYLKTLKMEQQKEAKGETTVACSDVCSTSGKQKVKKSPDRVLLKTDKWLEIIRRIPCRFCGVGFLVIVKLSCCGEMIVVDALCKLCGGTEQFSNDEERKINNQFDEINVLMVAIEITNKGSYETYKSKGDLMVRNPINPMSKHLFYKIVKYMGEKVEEAVQEDFDKRAIALRGEHLRYGSKIPSSIDNLFRSQNRAATYR